LDRRIYGVGLSPMLRMTLYLQRAKEAEEESLEEAGRGRWQVLKAESLSHAYIADLLVCT
jgi:hypothetical protein